MAVAAAAPPLYTFGTPWPALNEGVLYTDVVKSSSSDETLLHYYASRFKDSASEQGWLQRIRNGQIKVNGQVTTSPDAKLSFGSTIVYQRLPWSEPSAPYEIPVLFEDLHLIAINKPSGLQVLPGGLFQQRTVLQQLQWLSSALSQKLGDSSNVDVPQPTPVHRLGRGTSGVLLCAKTPESKSRLAAEFAGSTSLCSQRIPNVNTETKRRMTKTYRALVKGVVQNDKMVIGQPIGRLKYPGVSGGLYMASSTGKAAQSKVSVLWRDKTKQTTLVEVEIFSGRPHQIRIHMATIGHPLLGDPLYVEGGKPVTESRLDLDENATPAEDGGYAKPTSPVPGDCGYYLHAFQMSFCHPVGGHVVTISAPPPARLRTPSENS